MEDRIKTWINSSKSEKEAIHAKLCGVDPCGEEVLELNKQLLEHRGVQEWRPCTLGSAHLTEHRRMMSTHRRWEALLLLVMEEAAASVGVKVLMVAQRPLRTLDQQPFSAYTGLCHNRGWDLQQLRRNLFVTHHGSVFN